MADAIDMAATAEAELIAHGLARVDRTIAQGCPGECDDCGEWMPRLVHGRCGFCRDGRRPPAEAYDRSAQRRSTKETAVMTAKITPTNCTISLPVAGDILKAIKDRAAERDLPMGQAARSFIEEATASTPAASDPEWDGTLAGAATYLQNIPDTALIAEVVRRLNAGVGTDDYEAALARATTAETRLAQLREMLAG